jgi:hypothetical protein
MFIVAKVLGFYGARYVLDFQDSGDEKTIILSVLWLGIHRALIF